MTFRVRWRILYGMHRVTAKKKRIPVGFTLIELLVVIAIITLLSALTGLKEMRATIRYGTCRFILPQETNEISE